MWFTYETKLSWNIRALVVIVRRVRNCRRYYYYCALQVYSYWLQHCERATKGLCWRL